MKIKTVSANNRRHAFEVQTGRVTYFFPYSRTGCSPTADNPIIHLEIDAELGREAFTYQLASGEECSIHVEQVLDYNQDPGYMRKMLLFKLTVEAEKRIEKSQLSKREIIRRLGTSPAQFYRLLDTTNYRKSVDRMLDLLFVLDCEVELVVKST
jgi:hypothetical protein